MRRSDADAYGYFNPNFHTDCNSDADGNSYVYANGNIYSDSNGESDSDINAHGYNDA